MNQALLSIEDEVVALSDPDSWDVESFPVPTEKFRVEGTPALLFFWDGTKVHRIKDEQLKKEMARMTDYSF